MAFRTRLSIYDITCTVYTPLRPLLSFLKLKYGIVYFPARHIYESSLLYKLSDWYFKAARQAEYGVLPAASANISEESKTKRIIALAEESAYYKILPGDCKYIVLFSLL